MSDPDANEIPVENDTAAHRFEARFPEGLALLKYHYDRAGRLSLDHTEGSTRAPAQRRRRPSGESRPGFCEGSEPQSVSALPLR
jgi:hypothetical protein